jgi:hypothetical protein
VLYGCAGVVKKTDSETGAPAGPGTTIIVGKIIIDPEPEKGESWMFNSAYDGQIIIFIDKILKITGSHDDAFWDKWPLKIEGIENKTFFYGLRNKRYYSQMLGYLLPRNGEYELIKFPMVFTLDIQPGDGAIYIGTIKITRDLFYGLKRIDVYDEYNSALPEFIKRYGRAIKLKKAIAKVLNEREKDAARE